MLYTQVNQLIKEQQFDGLRIFSLTIPETVIKQFANHQIEHLARVNSSTKYVDQYASNLSKVFGNIGSVDVWSYDPRFLEEFEEKMRQKFEENYIYIQSSSINFDKEVDAFWLKLKIKQ